MGQVIYTARCVDCGAYKDRVGAPIADGDQIPHRSAWYDEDGLTRSKKCEGAFISIMGRTREEIWTRSTELRQAGQ